MLLLTIPEAVLSHNKSRRNTLWISCFFWFGGSLHFGEGGGGGRRGDWSHNKKGGTSASAAFGGGSVVKAIDSARGSQLSSFLGPRALAFKPLGTYLQLGINLALKHISIVNFP